MKYFTLIIALMFGLMSNAQTLHYSDSMIEIDGELVPTIQVNLEPQVSTIRDKFEDWIENNYYIDLDSKKLIFFDKDIMSANGIVIPEISKKQIDLKVKVDETNNDITRLNVYASFGYNNWITPQQYPYEHMALNGLVLDFVRDYLPSYYQKQAKETEERIAELESKDSELQKEIKENNVDIAELRKENAELIERLKKNQDKMKRAESLLKVKNMEYKTIKEKVSDIK